MKAEGMARHGSGELHMQASVKIRAGGTNQSTIFVWVTAETIEKDEI